MARISYQIYDLIEHHQLTVLV